MGEGSHSISALLNSCTIFLLWGVLQQVCVRESQGGGGVDYSLYSSEPLHSYRNCLWQRHSRKKKVKADWRNRNREVLPWQICNFATQQSHFVEWCCV